jgi:two-component system chemotaxis response regulator CheB
MGDDGTEGARVVRAASGHVWAQDQASSVIYGMPAAVAKAGLTEAVLPLKEVGAAISRSVR